METKTEKVVFTMDGLIIFLVIAEIILFCISNSMADWDMKNGSLIWIGFHLFALPYILVYAFVS